MFDLHSPWLRPLWLRVAITACVLLWATLEALNGAFGWAAIFAAAGLWCGYQFFAAWDPARIDAMERTVREEDER